MVLPLESIGSFNNPRSHHSPSTPDWNIVSDQMIANIATQVPTTLNELLGCGIPENVQKQYGERLVKSINTFIDIEQIQRYIENRLTKKPRIMDIPSIIQISKQPSNTRPSSSP